MPAKTTIMKKRLIVLAVVVLCVVLVVFCIELSGLRINRLRVEEIVLKTYDHKNYGKAELTAVEALKLITLYNLSMPAGQVNGEPCCDAYGFKVYFRDGSALYVGQGVKSKMIVRPKSAIRIFQRISC